LSAGSRSQRQYSHRRSPAPRPPCSRTCEVAGPVTPGDRREPNMDVVHRAVGKARRDPGPARAPPPAGQPAGRGEEAGRPGGVRGADRRIPGRSGEGQVPISQNCQRKIMRLPRQLKPAAISDLNQRLKALPAVDCQAPRDRCGRTPGSPRCPAEGPLARPPRRPSGQRGSSRRLHAERRWWSRRGSCRPRRSRSRQQRRDHGQHVLPCGLPTSGSRPGRR